MEESKESNDANDDTYGTWEYMAPECWHRKYGQPGKPSDVFSFGVMLWEVYSQLRPYTHFPDAPHENMRRVCLAGTKTFQDDMSVVPGWYACSESARPIMP